MEHWSKTPLPRQQEPPKENVTVSSFKTIHGIDTTITLEHTEYDFALLSVLLTSGKYHAVCTFPDDMDRIATEWLAYRGANVQQPAQEQDCDHKSFKCLPNNKWQCLNCGAALTLPQTETQPAQRTDYADLLVEMYHVLQVIKDSLTFIDADTWEKLNFKADIIKGIEQTLEKASPIVAELDTLEPEPPDTPEAATWICGDCGEEYDAPKQPCAQCGSGICDDCYRMHGPEMLCGDCWHKAQEVQ
jgi:hypothetical protein